MADGKGSDFILVVICTRLRPNKKSIRGRVALSSARFCFRPARHLSVDLEVLYIYIPRYFFF